MPTPKKLVKQINMVDETRMVAESMLYSLINSKVLPRTFSGLLTPRFGKYIMCWQFEKNKLIGAIQINVNNAGVFSTKILAAPNSKDWLDAINSEEVDTGNEPSPVQ